MQKNCPGREKLLGPRNTQEKQFWTHEISVTKNLGPMKYSREKILDPQNNQEKKSWTHEIPTRKSLGPTKNLREKISDLRKHNDMMTRDPRNLVKISRLVKISSSPKDI